MIELKDELLAAPIDEWHVVPFTENHHKWLLAWYRFGDGEFCFSFVSPKGRRYSFYTERGENGGRVVGADIAGAKNGARIVSYWESWGDKIEKMVTVLKRTPTHVLNRLSVLLEAIG